MTAVAPIRDLVSPEFELEYAQRVYDECPGLEVAPFPTLPKAEWEPHPIQELALQATADDKRSMAATGASSSFGAGRG